MDLKDSAVLSEQGYFVSEKMMRLGEIIQDYDQNLFLEWIPTDKRVQTDNAAPYRVVHYPPNLPAYVVLFAHESDNPEDILARIFASDNTRGNPIVTMDTRNAASEAFRLKKHAEELEEAADKFHFLLSPSRSKNYVTDVDAKTGEKIKFDAHRFRMAR